MTYYNNNNNNNNNKYNDIIHIFFIHVYIDLRSTVHQASTYITNL